MFQNNISNLYKLFETALMNASEKGFTTIVKLLLEQEGIDVNAICVFLFYFGFITII